MLADRQTDTVITIKIYAITLTVVCNAAACAPWRVP